MSIIDPIEPDSFSATKVWAVSDDGHIRLPFTELQTVFLIHLISGLDEDAPEMVPRDVSRTTITGYTEWVSNTTPAITIGWDWQMHESSQLRRVSEPRTNLMLQDACMADICFVKSTALLEAFVDALDWQSIVLEQIVTRYS